MKLVFLFYISLLGEQNGNEEEVLTVNFYDVHMNKKEKKKCEKEMEEKDEDLTNSNTVVTKKKKKVRHKVTEEECELGSDEVYRSSAKKSKKDKQKKKKVKTEPESMSLSDNGVNNQDQCPSVKKKKIKKSVVLEDEVKSDEEKGGVKSMEDSQTKKTKKKKKSKNKIGEGVKDLTEMCDEDKQSKKEKKKKKSKDKSDECMEDLTEMCDGTDLSNKQWKKQKKKKPKNKDNKDTDDQATEPENGAKKGGKDKHKMTDHGTENGITKDCESVNEDRSESPKGKKRKKKKGKDTDDEPDLKRSKDGLEPGPRVENKKTSNDPDPAYSGQWTTASLGDEQRQNKFLRLLGGFKAAKSDTSLLSTLGGKCGNVAMTQNQEDWYMRSMEDQYGKAMSFNRNRGLGLGFEKPPSEGKKFYIDKNMSKSKKFDD